MLRGIFNGCGTLQVSLARTPGSAFTGILYSFAIVAMIPLVAINAVSRSQGILSLVIFSVLMVLSLPLPPYRAIWYEVGTM